MQKVDTILAHGTVVTMDDDYTIHPDGAVAIQDDRIVAAGPAARIMAEYSAAETVDCSGHIVMPGLINAHTHASMTLLRGLADDLRLDVWLMGYIMPVEREFVTPEFCELGTTLACAEMIRGGTTTFADMYYFEADVARATARAGMRGVLCQTILKFPSPDAPTFEDSLQATRDFIDQWKDHPLITPTIAPHAPYSNTEETLQRASRIASEHGLPLMIHIAETEREQKENLQQYGKTAGTMDQGQQRAGCADHGGALCAYRRARNAHDKEAQRFGSALPIGQPEAFQWHRARRQNAGTGTECGYRYRWAGQQQRSRYVRGDAPDRAHRQSQNDEPDRRAGTSRR